MTGAKKPPQKKRHTKPCRYFQTGRCPQSAEGCDFAHVFSLRPALPNPKPCRYYLAGNCNNGIWCQYRHAGDVQLEDYEATSPIMVQQALNYPKFELLATSPPADYTPSSPLNRVYMMMSAPWSPYADVTNSPRLPPDSPHAHLYYPANSLDSTDGASSVSSPTSSISDDVVMITSDESYFAEPQSLYRSAPYGDESTITPFGYSSRPPLTVVPPAYGMVYPVYDILSPTHAPPGLSSQPPRSDASRQKLANYRTKPCRYYKPGSVCPNGDSCTFIHDLDKKPSTLTVSEDSSPIKLQHDLPSKPLSAKEENSRKGFFPISWRVIGGGVLLSGVKDSASLSDDGSEFSEDSLSAFDGRSDPFSKVLEIDIPAHTPSDVEFPSTESSSDHSITPTGYSRTRASSIPSTPMTAHVDILRLFLNESPGGL
ncbi:hypothetical protein B0H10DRAFT_1288428 [Mycena sp. CBHHK59/15]|nr:hypothetical protein B0H10DRAFT_1288428 [Mycena sp. CBHHK59/15]